MNKNIAIILTIILSLSIFGCQNTAEVKPKKAAFDQSAIDFQVKLFDKAIQLKDPYTAVVAANSILLMDSSGKTRKYQDTLAGLYTALGMNGASSKMADNILKKDTNNIKMLEVKTSGLLAEGKFAEAMKCNNRLYELTKKPHYLFQTAYMQIESQKMSDANATIQKVLKIKGYEKDSVDFSANPQTGIPAQKAPLNAAVVYLQAYMDIQKQDYQGALVKYDRALKIYPNFYKAKENMQIIIQGMQKQQAAQQQGGQGR